MVGESVNQGAADVAGPDVNLDLGKKPRILVTRPAHDAEHWVKKLQQAGFDAAALPLIEIAPSSSADDARALQQVWRDISSYAACMFVSGNAADYFFKPNMLSAQQIWDKLAIKKVADHGWEGTNQTLRFLAPGPGTRAALVANGVPAERIDAPPADAAQFDSEALWQLVGNRDWRGTRVLIVRGITSVGSGAANTGGSASAPGRDWIARQWQAAGADVSFVSVYERRAPVFNPAQIEAAKRALADGSIWLFSSSEAVANLTGQAGLMGADWSRARAVATHPRILEAVRSAGWGVVRESRPALDDILNSLRSIESPHPSS